MTKEPSYDKQTNYGHRGLALQSRVNGQTRQNSNTNDMIFDIATIVSVLSEGFTLYPGDLIATGTPEGVGFAMDPPRLLKVGDVVECEVENMGCCATTSSHRSKGGGP